jgi:phosphatidylglycerol:prolipoprotein diacylglycerol transferase
VRPILFQLGPIPISAFGVFLLLAFLAAIALGRRLAQRQLGVDPTTIVDLSLYAVVAGIVGGRIGYILVNLGQFADDPSRILTIWRDGGLVYYGGLLGGLALARWYTRAWPQSFGALLDVFAAPLILGYGIAMIGALLHGLFQGRATDVPWAVELFLERRHPTQLYLAAASLAILSILRAQRAQTLVPGTLFVLAIFLQAIARFAVDFFIEARAVAGPLTVGQLFSAIAAGISLWLLVSLQRRAPEARPGPDPIAGAPA